MKKRSTYLLLGLVIVVWGGIFYRLFSRADEVPPVRPQPVVAAAKADVAPSAPPPELVLDYPDPFLKRSLPAETEDVGLAVDDFMMEEAPMPMDIDWTFITYSGIISNSDHKKRIGLVTIHGREAMVREGQTIEGVRLIRIREDDLLVEYQDREQTISKQSQQIHETQIHENNDFSPVDSSTYGSM